MTTVFLSGCTLIAHYVDAPTMPWVEVLTEDEVQEMLAQEREDRYNSPENVALREHSQPYYNEHGSGIDVVQSAVRKEYPSIDIRLWQYAPYKTPSREVEEHGVPEMGMFIYVDIIIDTPELQTVEDLNNFSLYLIQQLEEYQVPYDRLTVEGYKDDVFRQEMAFDKYDKPYLHSKTGEELAENATRVSYHDIQENRRNAEIEENLDGFLTNLISNIF